VEDALGRIAALGKPSGIISLNAAEIAHFIALDTTFIAVGADAAILSAGAVALVQQYKK